MKKEKQVELFKELNERNEAELQRVLRARGLDTEGSKTELIQRVIRSEPIYQHTNRPQALAIKTKDNPNAVLWMQSLNKAILPQNEKGELLKKEMKAKAFEFIDRSGNKYVLKCPYRKAKPSTIQMLLENEWILPLENQVELVRQIKANPSKFTFYFIRKRDINSRWYTMIWVAPKEAAAA